MKQIGVMLGFALAVSSAVSMPSTQPSDPRLDDAAKAVFDKRLTEARTGTWDVVFLGDGYVKGWGGPLEGKPVWTTCFSDAGLKALNLGFVGDRTENLLWRIQAGELDGYKTKTVVLEIGGENRVHRGERETVLDTLAGIWRCLQAIRTKQPDARIVLHPVFPRARKPTDPSRLHAAAVNRELVKLADGKGIVWCDFTDGLLESDGSLPIELIPYHYQPAYLYRLWGSALLPMLGGKGTVCPQRYANRLSAGMFDSGEIRECSGRSKIGIRNSWDPFPNWWLERSIGKREEAWELSEGGKKPIDLVFLGDSITHNWDGDRQSGWPMPGAKRLADLRKRYSVLPIGFGGDDTSTLLWRVKNGHIDGYRARLVQLMIGTNNVLSRPEDTARGIREILDEIIRRQPTAKVLLLPVFPCGEKPDYVMRRRNAAVNKIIRKYADGKRILWHDFTGRFVQPDGTISKKMMGDFLHPGADGYDIWYEEVLPIFEKVLMTSSVGQRPGFERGIGMGGWLTNYKRFNVLRNDWRMKLTEGDFEHFETFITERDVAYVAKCGFDHIRLGFDQIVLEESPGKYCERTFRCVDNFVGWCRKHGLGVVLNLHKAIGNYCDIPGGPSLMDEKGLQDRFVALWLEFERRYHNDKALAFELLNEVNSTDCEKWNALAERTVKAIRAVNAERTIVVGSCGGNYPQFLDRLRVFDDPHVVYTFHWYDPGCFTHQQGVLKEEYLYYNRKLAYPSDDVERYREFDRVVRGVTNSYAGVSRIDRRWMRRELDSAFRWKAKHPDKVLWAGEFGTIRHADARSRVAWMRDMVSICREGGFPYCVWNYLSTPNDGNRFSLVDDDTREFLSRDLLDACLGL